MEKNNLDILVELFKKEKVSLNDVRFGDGDINIMGEWARRVLDNLHLLDMRVFDSVVVNYWNGELGSVWFSFFKKGNEGRREVDLALSYFKEYKDRLLKDIYAVDCLINGFDDMVMEVDLVLNIIRVKTFDKKIELNLEKVVFAFGDDFPQFLLRSGLIGESGRNLFFHILLLGYYFNYKKFGKKLNSYKRLIRFVKSFIRKQS